MKRLPAFHILITITFLGGYNAQIYLYTLYLFDSAGLNTINGIIGVRYARNCHPDDLWTSYFTSSKHVQVFREQHGEPDVIEVRQTFNDSLQAREWEHKVLRRLKVIQNEKWLNKTDNFSINLDYFMAGRKQSDETKKKISIKLKGKRKGVPHSEEHINKLRKPKSEDHKRKIQQANRGYISVFDSIDRIVIHRLPLNEYYNHRERYHNLNSKIYKDFKNESISRSCKI